MRIIAPIAIILFISGCAGTTYRPIADDNQDGGIRYYEQAPYLLISTNGKGGVTGQIKFIADVTAKRSINPFAILSQNESTLTFDNGVLTQGKSTVDETTVPRAIVTALEKVASAAMAAANAPGDEPQQIDIPLPRLYRIVITSTTVSLEGGKIVGADGETELQTIRATISDPSTNGTVAAPVAKAGNDGAKAADKEAKQ